MLGKAVGVARSQADTPTWCHLALCATRERPTLVHLNVYVFSTYKNMQTYEIRDSPQTVQPNSHSLLFKRTRFPLRLFQEGRNMRLTNDSIQAAMQKYDWGFWDTL